MYSKLGSAMNYTATKWLAKPLEKAYKEPTKYAARLLVYSFISKDMINTCVYTYQSLNNEKIPKEKRSFVAANDLVLGFFNFGGQILAQSICEKFITPGLESKYTGEKAKNYVRSKAHLSRDNVEKIAKDLIKEKDIKINAEEVKEVLEHVVKKAGAGSQRGKDITAGLAIVISSLATTAFIKRTISPLFSTPIAGWLGDKWDKKAEKADADPKAATKK